MSSKEILEEINKVRQNPSSYVEKILKYKDYFEGKDLKIPGESARIVTKEGYEAYEEAANFLSQTKYVQELIPSKGLFNIANDYLTSLQKVGMDKIDSVDINAIIDKYGNFDGQFNQLMEFGSSTPEQIVINLLVCDGDLDRIYRQNLLDPNLKKIGIAFGKNDIYNNCTIIVASSNFKNKDKSDDNHIFEEKPIISSQSGQSSLPTLFDMIGPDSKKEEEEKQKKEAEEKQKKEEEERLKKEEEERLKKEAEEKQKKEEEERLKKEAEEKQKKEEEERLKKEAEEKQKKE